MHFIGHHKMNVALASGGEFLGPRDRRQTRHWGDIFSTRKLREEIAIRRERKASRKARL